MSPAKLDERSLSLLMEMTVPVRISFGSARVPLGELLDVGPGSVIQLDAAVDQEVELIVNGRVIGRGEAVEFEGDYGVRIRSLEYGALDGTSEVASAGGE